MDVNSKNLNTRKHRCQRRGSFFEVVCNSSCVATRMRRSEAGTPRDLFCFARRELPGAFSVSSLVDNLFPMWIPPGSSPRRVTSGLWASTQTFMRSSVIFVRLDDWSRLKVFSCQTWEKLCRVNISAGGDSFVIAGNIEVEDYRNEKK